MKKFIILAGLALTLEEPTIGDIFLRDSLYPNRDSELVDTCFYGTGWATCYKDSGDSYKFSLPNPYRIRDFEYNYEGDWK